MILLLEHGERGSYGVILNRPSSVHMRDLDLGRPLPEFDDCRLYLGGDVGDKEVLLVHPHGELKGGWWWGEQHVCPGEEWGSTRATEGPAPFSPNSSGRAASGAGR